MVLVLASPILYLVKFAGSIRSLVQILLAKTAERFMPLPQHLYSGSPVFGLAPRLDYDINLESRERRQTDPSAFLSNYNYNVHNGLGNTGLSLEMRGALNKAQPQLLSPL